MKNLSAGAEIDAWCTRCKMILVHRIIALVDRVPARVVCSSCGSQHNYKKTGPSTTSAPIIRRRDGSSALAKPAAVRSSRPSAPSARALAEATRLKEWETRVLGQSLQTFTRYSMERDYAAGELITHPKFGDGFVAEVLDRGKVSIMFRDGPRTLAHGQTR